MDKKKIALIFGCAALIGAFLITAPNPSWAAACDAACQAEKVEIKVAAAKAAPEEKATLLAEGPFDKIADKKRKKAKAKAAAKAAPAEAAPEAAVEEEAAVDKRVNRTKKKTKRSGGTNKLKKSKFKAAAKATATK